MDDDSPELDVPDSVIDREMADLKSWTPERVRQEALGVVGHLVRRAGRHLWRSMQPGAVVPRNAREVSENARFILKSALEAQLPAEQPGTGTAVQREVVFVKENDLERVLEKRLKADQPS